MKEETFKEYTSKKLLEKFHLKEYDEDKFELFLENKVYKEITDQKLRETLDNIGLSDIHLEKNKGYFYIWASEGTVHDKWLSCLPSTSIYVNSFKDLSIDEWISEIRKIVNDAKKAYYSEMDEIVENFENKLKKLDENNTITFADVESHTIFEEEYDTYYGKFENFWWSFSPSFGMSKTDGSDHYKQFKVMAGIVGKPKTRKVLATKANYNNVFEIVAKYLNSISSLVEDFTMGVGAPVGADQGIPHSMDGCAVPMMPLGCPPPYGRIQKFRHHKPFLHRLPPPIIIVNRSKKKKKKKKSKKHK